MVRAESEVGEMTERCVAEEAESLLRDMQEYRNLSDRVRSMFGDAATLKDVVDSLERKVLEPEKPDPVNARILTYEESAMWDAYRAIGTPEQCQEAVERTRLIPVSERMPEGIDVCNYIASIENYGVDIATYVPSVKEWYCWGMPCKVIAWMPLPEPYHIAKERKKVGDSE